MEQETTSPSHHNPYSLVLWLTTLLLHSIGKLLGLVNPVPPEVLGWSEEISFIMAICVSCITIISWLKRKFNKHGHK